MVEQGKDAAAEQDLVCRIEAGGARVAILGLGYVGLGLALALAESGLEVLGCDTDPERVGAVADAREDLPDAPADRLRPLVASGRLRPTVDPEGIGDCDAVVICVPTPLRKSREPDISHVLAAVRTVRDRVRPGALVVLESTTYPGTTEEILRPALEERGLRVGREVFLAFSPERMDPGNTRHGLSNTPKVVGGCTTACSRAAAALYRRITPQVVTVSDPATAEMSKILENTFRAVNIGLANEVALICERLGLDVWEVVRAAATKPYGFLPFWPGPGLGGHCIPVDPQYLTWRVRMVDFVPRLIELADEVNRAMPDHVVALAADALNDCGRAVKGSRVAVLGIAYKRDVGDTRESPALRVVHLLRGKGAEVSCHDPFVRSFRLEDGTEVGTVALDEALEGSHCTLILTDHSAFDAAAIVRRSAVVVDTRNLTGDLDDPRIRRLGDGRPRLRA